MRVWLAIAVAALLLVAAAALEAPASLLDGRVASMSAGHVRIAAATGTLWHGSGELVLLPGGARTPLAWTIDPSALLRGILAGTAKFDAAARAAGFEVDGNRVAVRDLALSLPAAAVLKSAGVAAPLGAAGGTLALDVARLDRDGQRLDAAITLRWHEASLPDPGSGTRIALGEVRLDAAGSGTQVPARVSNEGGDVALSGTIVFASRGLPKVDTLVKPRESLNPERRQAVDALLGSVGRSDGAAGYRVVWPLFGS
ncbi:MAG TPA: type II secretion system protein N [Casimicrobiaceae bacterium]|nr:type II secretion system protein N [Casimicrobiaceae bacterium]